MFVRKGRFVPRRPRSIDRAARVAAPLATFPAPLPARRHYLDSRNQIAVLVAVLISDFFGTRAKLLRI